MPETDMARMLLELAQGDLKALEVMLQSKQVPSSVCGFHAQQATEKALKAWLVLLDVDYPLTHSLLVLLDLVRKTGAECTHYGALTRLTPYAVELRYDSDTVGAQVDPAAVAPTVADLVSYVRELLAAAEAGE